MFFLALAALVAVTSLLALIFYDRLLDSVRADIRILADTLRGATSGEVLTLLEGADTASTRVTVMAPDGAVVFDSSASIAQLPNHADREEFTEAAGGGRGESERLSDTLGEYTYYYAVRLADGYVLRTARTTRGILSILLDALPLILVVILVLAAVTYAAARRLTARIVRPINESEMDGSGLPCYDELVPFFRVMAQQRGQILAQLRELRGRSDTIGAIMESMNEGAIIVEPGGAVLSANVSALGIFGLDQMVVGRNLREIIRDAALLSLANGALAGNRSETEFERHGRVYNVYFSPAASVGAILLFLDVTEKSNAEKLRREFSANVSHELKTPLTTISGYAQLLDSGMAREEDRAEFIRKIHAESERMTALIDDILLLSRLDEGAAGEEFREVCLNELAQSVVSLLAEKAKRLGVHLRTEGGPVSVAGSPALLTELLRNLLDNAIKYNRPGGSATVTLSDEGGHAVLTVADTGTGISKSAQSRVFERFYRADTSHSRRVEGTGLGLAIVKHIAAVHHAEVSLESREGAGTTVKVRM
jgi:two-component system phosphate regulon sensor histidine kinase PhoR